MIALFLTLFSNHHSACLLPSTHRQHLANNLVISEKRHIVQQNRYSDMVQHIYNESHVWVTKDNYEEKINARLFDTMATTGLVTRSSNYWRYMSVPLTPERKINFQEEKFVQNNGKFYSNDKDYQDLTTLESTHRYGKLNYIFISYL